MSLVSSSSFISRYLPSAHAHCSLVGANLIKSQKLRLIGKPQLLSAVPWTDLALLIDKTQNKFSPMKWLTVYTYRVGSFNHPGCLISIAQLCSESTTLTQATTGPATYLTRRARAVIILSLLPSAVARRRRHRDRGGEYRVPRIRVQPGGRRHDRPCRRFSAMSA